MSVISDEIRSEFENIFNVVVDYYYSWHNAECSLRDNFDGSMSEVRKYFERCSNSVFMTDKIKSGNMKLGWLLMDEVIKDVRNGRYHRSIEVREAEVNSVLSDMDNITEEVATHVEKMKTQEPLLCWEVRKKILNSREGVLSYKTWLMDDQRPVSMETGHREIVPASLSAEQVLVCSLFDVYFVESVVFLRSKDSFMMDMAVRRLEKYGVYHPNEEVGGPLQGTKFDFDAFLSESPKHKEWYNIVLEMWNTHGEADICKRFLDNEGESDPRCYLNPDLWTND